jgi:hypothetical protein
VTDGAADGVADGLADAVPDGLADEVADGLGAAVTGEAAGELPWTRVSDGAGIEEGLAAPEGGSTAADDEGTEGAAVPERMGLGAKLRTSPEMEYRAHHESAADEGRDKGDEFPDCPDTGRRKERASRSGGNSGSSTIHCRNFSFSDSPDVVPHGAPRRACPTRPHPRGPVPHAPPRLRSSRGPVPHAPLAFAAHGGRCHTHPLAFAAHGGRCHTHPIVLAAHGGWCRRDRPDGALARGIVPRRHRARWRGGQMV